MGAHASKILKDTSSGAVGQTYSFAQTHMKIQGRSDLARSEVVTIIRNLARQDHSTALAQLAFRVVQLSQGRQADKADQFGEIKGLIRDMIAKLETAAKSEATEKAYCDEHMSRTQAKNDELDEDIAKLT